MQAKVLVLYEAFNIQPIMVKKNENMDFVSDMLTVMIFSCKASYLGATI